MKILQLSVKNYRPFAERPPFDFNGQFSVIAGVNGRGKTAVLDAIALCLSRLLPQITKAKGGQRTLQPSDVHHGQGEAEFVMRLNCAGYPVDEFKVTYQKERRLLRPTKLPPAVKHEIRNRYGLDNTRSNDAAPIAVYYTTDRAGFRRPKYLPSRTATSQAAAYHGALSSRMVNYRDLMLRLTAMIQVENSEPRSNRAYFGERTIHAIQEALARFLEGFSNLRVESRPLSLKVDKHGIPLDLGQLSDGERSFLAIVCDVCRRLTLANPQLPNPLEGEGIVLIDELELHLHPTWQREVVEKLRSTFPKLQFIVTTHSPFIIQSIRGGELTTLDPKEFPPEYADKSIEDISETVMGVDLPQKSERYQQMMKAAEDYFRLLRESQILEGEDLETAKRKLDELSAPFSDDPAYQALLKVERETTLGGSQNAAS